MGHFALREHLAKKWRLQIQHGPVAQHKIWFALGDATRATNTNAHRLTVSIGGCCAEICWLALLEDLTTGKPATLKTRDKDEAYRLVAAKNENEDAPAFSLHLARVYWKAGDPTGATRTWQHVMDEIPKLETGETQYRWLTAIKQPKLRMKERQILPTLPKSQRLPGLLQDDVSPPGHRIRWHH